MGGRVFFFFFWTCFFALIDRKWLGRNFYLLVVTCICYSTELMLKMKMKKRKEKKKLKCDNSFFSFFFGQDLTRD